MNLVADVYFVALHAAFGLLLLRSGLVGRLLVRLRLRKPGDDPLLTRMHTLHKMADEHVPPCAVIFLGDSLIQLMQVNTVTPLAVNFGTSSQRTDQLLRSMEHYRSLSRASAVVVMIGTNDLRLGLDAGIAERYRAILAKIPAGVPVVWSAIPPIAGKDRKSVVEAARQVCAERAGCVFLDPFEGRGELLLIEDGVHLSNDGYRVLIDQLRPVVAHVSSPC